MTVGRRSLLSGASVDLRRLVEGLATSVRLDAGAMLFSQGDEGDAFYLVKDGEIEISVLSPNGRRLALDVMRKGDVLGEIALFGGSRTATAVALKPSVLDQVRRPDVMAAIRARPDLGLQFVDLLCERLREVSAKLEELTFLALPARVASRLIYLDRKIGDGIGAVRISQADLADFVGATREGVAKILAEWRGLGWVALSRGTCASSTALRSAPSRKPRSTDAPAPGRPLRWSVPRAGLGREPHLFTHLTYQPGS